MIRPPQCTPNVVFDSSANTLPALLAVLSLNIHADADLISDSCFYVSDFYHCMYESWKNLACALEIEPCNRSLERMPFCKSDCVQVRSHCLR